MKPLTCHWCHQKIRNYGIGGFHFCPDVPAEYLEDDE